MNLNDALTEIATYLNLDADDLIRYADEDEIGGYSDNALVSRWPAGSLWEDEGKTLYALVRALKPRHILELGVHVGCSTSHLRAGIQKNSYGLVRSVDRWEGAGKQIPDYLQHAGILRYEYALDHIAKLDDNEIDFVFEDLIHYEQEVFDILTALAPKLKPHALIVHHDSEHGDDGVKVKRGIERAGISDYLSLLCGSTDCGLAIYRWNK